MTTLRIDFVSDVVCPWCAIGLASLEQALQRLDGDVRAELRFQPFELNPQLPAEGESIAEHLQRKYGLSDAQLADNQERIRQRGAELGFAFDFNARSRIWNTFDAHRLLHWAGLEGRQRVLKHALLRAYFGEGRNVSDRDTLVAIAEGAGLDAERARAILASDDYADAVEGIGGELSNGVGLHVGGRLGGQVFVTRSFGFVGELGVDFRTMRHRVEGPLGGDEHFRLNMAHFTAQLGIVFAM